VLGQRPHHQQHHQHQDRTSAAAVNNVGLQRASPNHNHNQGQSSEVRSVGAAYHPAAHGGAANVRGSIQRGLTRLEPPAVPLGDSALTNHHQPHHHLVVSPAVVKPPGHGRGALRSAFVDRATSTSARAALEGTATSTASDESSTQAPAFARLRSEASRVAVTTTADDGASDVDVDGATAASFDTENVDPFSSRVEAAGCGGSSIKQPADATPSAPAQRSGSHVSAPAGPNSTGGGSNSGSGRRLQHAVLHDTPYTPSDAEPTQPIFGTPMDAVAEDQPHVPVHPTPPAGAKPAYVGRHHHQHRSQRLSLPAAGGASAASPSRDVPKEVALRHAAARLNAAHGPGEIRMGAALAAKGLSVPVLRRMLSTPTPAMVGELFSRVVGRILRRHKGFAIEPLPPSVYHMFPCYTANEFRDPTMGLAEVVHRLIVTYATAEPAAWLVVLWYMARLAAVADAKAQAFDGRGSQPSASSQGSTAQHHRMAVSPRYCVSRAAGDADRLPSISSGSGGAAGAAVVSAGGPDGCHHRRFKHHQLAASTTRGIPAMATAFDPRFAASFTVSLYAMSECAIGDYSCYARYYTHEGGLKRYRCPTTARREHVCPWDLSSISKRQWLAADALDWQLTPGGRDLADIIARFCSIDEAAAAVRYARVEAE
jgi:hypothetical protein